MESSLMARILIVHGDITRLDEDAIVNAANSSLLGGGGVDGAIHAAAGPELLEECKTLGGCPTGEARLTRGYRLPARHVIHTVGPVWMGGIYGEAEKLTACYQNSLQLAAEQGFTTVAFPSISTGVFGYPIEKACPLALRTTLTFLSASETPRRVTFVCFSRRDFELYQQVWAKLQAT
jgi:O-acetyl-ADP-ribose deacetylase (regulator of RNase III)